MNSVVLAVSDRTEIRCGSCDAGARLPVSRMEAPISRN
jgi:hypothetical protein